MRHRSSPKEISQLWELGLKRCVACREIKEPSEFHKCRENATTGLASRCKLCMSQYAKEYLKQEYVKEKISQNIHSDEYRKKALEQRTNERFSPETRDKILARDAIATAIKRGKMKPARDFDCILKSSECSIRMEYHHYLGYNPQHRLDVIPVCSFHHKELDDQHGLYRRDNS